MFKKPSENSPKILLAVAFGTAAELSQRTQAGRGIVSDGEGYSYNCSDIQ